MLRHKRYRFGKIEATYFYSDSGMKIRSGDNDPVDEALVLAGDPSVYVETDIPIDAVKEEAPDVVEQIFGTFITAARASELVPIIQAAVQEAQTDEDASSTPELYPAWSGDAIQYTVGFRVRYGGKLYKVLQAHTSQPDWAPDAALSLFAEILIPDPEVIPEWVQPDSTNPYMTGDKVMYNGKVYESLIDNNVWSPEAYPAGWREV